MIKKWERIREFFNKKTLGYSLERSHIELIERPQILGTLWNWSEDWKASQVQSSFDLSFTASRYAFSFIVSKTQMLHAISHEWSRPVHIPLCVFVWDTKLYFPCVYPTTCTSQNHFQWIKHIKNTTPMEEAKDSSPMD